MNKFFHAFISGILLNLFFFLATPTFAATYPTGFQESTYVSELNQPTSMDFAPDGRLFIAEQNGLDAVAKLHWSSASQANEMIPTAQLFSW